ncbi:GNAT family N-acetyltransferase [Tolypothrix campylonemoides VB511288]|nr:GNAT family N-acetyltransferase [Tolypothrix campylonemoides VB511288]
MFLTSFWFIRIGARYEVATSELFLAGGAAGIYNVATLEKFRNRGIGTAITLAALQDAYRVGYQTATLQASEAGKNIYSRLGFRQHCKFNVYNQNNAFRRLAQ